MSPGSQKILVTRSSAICEPTVTTTSSACARMPSAAITSVICSRSRGTPWAEPYCSATWPSWAISVATSAARESSGSAARLGMPPASETTSGRLATANSARIFEAVMPSVRRAKRSARSGYPAAAELAATWPAAAAEPDSGTAGRESGADEAAAEGGTRTLRGRGGPYSVTPECRGAPIGPTLRRCSPTGRGPVGYQPLLDRSILGERTLGTGVRRALAGQPPPWRSEARDVCDRYHARQHRRAAEALSPLCFLGACSAYGRAGRRVWQHR